ncbi:MULTISPECIES: pyridoxal phosphate-dependent aminotransferase [Burkholderia]|jgi:aspartate/methionine/tyrosine aminotransferase|uniref:Aminotransferase n=2 Tax=Burkholderia contaminans TaxID=488447 RepID=A0A1E3FXG2_9BURK|nr:MULTISPECIES: pyridoxal phosphate-dependent aminotransferase [Burkholderia]KKL40414.1 aspartate aminotransferase [Burkholderia contaminans LMG 23361]MBA9835446.1 pyridoxal phosphate-dependent aminotransferase [Burkholderia contaminans]MBA9842647.1 pyridoxal phosphate-dependent aminotransferase [Burkholderia contaminans]MBA9867997.1 pyridoxal phosphate-dependent aminotransferase [Burkholderia contaminans]MBA9910670.1 pyridoxal phosphate-dependent aminotransferase [Burkholderia contaminans]
MVHPADSLPVAGSPAARDAVHALRPSLIREVANAGFGVPDMLPFWFGESDRVTPDFIRDAAAAALRDGATFYTHNLGTAPLRDAIASYVSARHGATAADTVAVTSSGVSALMLVAQMLVGPGERVVAVTPLWPNLVEIPKILGAQVECVPLGYGDAGWQLDVGRLLAALTRGTRMLLINSPNNPTGWTMSRDDQQAVLAHCRRHGIWLVADEVYERLAFDADDAHGAPSFLDIASRDERVVVVNSFSKAWAMTGWRLGWLVAPAAVMADLSKLVEYNTSCAPGFVQAAGEVALRDGEPFVRSFVAALRDARDHLVAALRTLPGVEVPPPPGAMYLFLRLPGASDSLAFCKTLVREAGLGLAPGSAFGPEGEGFVRWCYACDPARLDAGVERLRRFLARFAAGR